MSEHEYYVDADKIRVMQTPKGSTYGNDQRVVALCATDAGGMDVAVRIAEMLNGSSGYAPQASPCVLSTETKEALGVAIAFFDDAIRKKNEAMAECQNLGQERQVRNLFSQRNSLERHQLLIQQVVTSHPRSAASTVEPVAPMLGAEVKMPPYEYQPFDNRTGSASFSGYGEYTPVTVSGSTAAPTTSPEPDVTDSCGNVFADLGVSPEPDAVREALRSFKMPDGDTLGEEMSWQVHAHLVSVENRELHRAEVNRQLDAILAALSRPARGAWEEALNPLAGLYDQIDDRDADPDTDVFFQHDGTKITFGDIRRARALLARNNRGSEAQ